MKDETTQRGDNARDNEASEVDAAQAEAGGLQAERDSAAAMNAEVPQPPDESQATKDQSG